MAPQFTDRPMQRGHEIVKAGPLLFRDTNITESKANVDPRTLRYVIAPGACVNDVRDGVAGNVLGNEGAQPGDPRRVLLAPGKPELAKDDPITNPPGADVWQPSGGGIPTPRTAPPSAATRKPATSSSPRTSAFDSSPRHSPARTASPSRTCAACHPQRRRRGICAAARPWPRAPLRRPCRSLPTRTATIACSCSAPGSRTARSWRGRRRSSR